MKISIRSLCILACSVFALLAPAASQAQTTSSSHIEQRALDILKNCCDRLAAAHAFSYHTDSSVEIVAKSGQLVTLFANSDVAMLRPNKLKIQITGEVPNFDFYYNGSTVAAYAPDTNVYSVCNAPATIDAMLPFLREKTGIRFPSAGILFSDPYSVLTKGLTSAAVIDSDAVDGTPCYHLAFSGPGVNWEIWVAEGGRPLPRRLVYVYTDVARFPRFYVEFTHWNLHPWISSGSFDFAPPAGAKQIDFLPIGKRAAAAK